MSADDEYPKRPGVSEHTLRAACIRFSDYPEPGSIEIPYPTPDGDLSNFKRWRLPAANSDRKYHQEKGTKVYVYYPPFCFRKNGEYKFGLTAAVIFLVEGEFKTLSLLEYGIWALGIPSFTVYSRDDSGTRQLLRDLQVTFGKEKPSAIYFLGDNDTCTNFEFSRNAEFLASAVNPAKVLLPRIPMTHPKGIDDCREALGNGFDAFFAELLKTAIELPTKISAPRIALILLERETDALKALSGLAREEQFERLVKLCSAAQYYDQSQATARICKLVCEIIGLTTTELTAAIKDRRDKDARERKATETAQKTTTTALAQPKKPELVLPSGVVTFTDVADKAFPILAARRRYFVRDRLIVEIAYKKPMKDNQLHDVFQLLEPDAFRSRLEQDFTCFAWREKDNKSVLKPSRCTNDAAKVLLKTDEAFKHLPTISFLSAQPVYTMVGDELKILYRGYHDVHGGIYVSHDNGEIVIPELDAAVALILDALKDFDFVSDSDKSRAVAALISPALRIGKFLGDADFPIDISEGDQSQSGKTFRLKLICAIYGETPYVIANRVGGVGSLDESISTALVAGVPFILFENFRGQMNSQLVESCLRGTGMVPARIPHRGEVQVSTTHLNWQLSSNGIEATRDFINRSVINRISKRPADYKFATYAEGNILAHIKANQSQYLGAVFSIIRHWHAEGCLRTDENRHDFTEWARTLDWIVQLFGLPSLLDGHVEEVLRVSDPALTWLRQIGIAVENDKRLDQGLSASDLVDICQAHNIEFPNKTSTTDLDQLARLAGRLLGRVFSDVSTNEELAIDRYEIKRESIAKKRDDGGDYTQHCYWFSKRD